MAPPPPPEIMDDVIGEILLRLPPGDPACLVRASLVCKSWRRLLSDGAFLHHYRAFHRTPPMLGFFQHQYLKGTGSVLQYVPTIHASPVPQQAIAVAGSPSSSYRIVDCRHGRVLFQDGNRPSFIVWDPIAGNQKRISPPVHTYVDYSDFMAALICAADGCDHLGCSLGPFLVLVVGIYYGVPDDEGFGDGDRVAWASLYSSKTGMWSASTTSVALESNCFIDDVVLPSMLARDAIYFVLAYGERILKYSVVGDVLSVMSMPPLDEPDMIFASHDGELGAAIMEGYSLHLWLWRTERDGVGEWARCRVIDLAVIIPFSIGDPSTVFHLAGFAQCDGSIFISANDDIFTVELKSGLVTKIGKRTSYMPIFPFTSFYTPDLVMTRFANEDWLSPMKQIDQAAVENLLS